MATEFSRRGFLGAGIAGVGATLAGAERANAAAPVVREVKGDRIKLSLAAYSFNRLLPRGIPEKLHSKAKMTMHDFVEFCARNNLGACEPTGYYFPKDVTPEYLLNFKAKCFRLGLDISGTAIGNDFCLPEGEKRQEDLAMTRQWIDNAAIMGAPVIRIFAGNVPDGDTEDAAIERCIAGINESLDYAAQKGVALGLENHGGITATPESMLKIIQGVKDSPWFGVNFDSGNFHTADPYAAMEQIAPYVITAQMKVSVKPDGGEKQKGDFKRIIEILKSAGYRGYIALEYEEDEDPFTAIPPLLDELRGLLYG